ncbi:MAG: malate synthase A, partial [Candidatus Melainabacteria bacterium]|nr:malate synthase A [Candidatus Melainabacteria bacterium]
MKVDGIKVTGPILGRDREILTPDALRFAANLAREFEARRQELLKARDVRQAEFDRGMLPNFLHGTANIRESDWTVAPIVSDLEKRHVEITGPVDRKMMINAFNSGADVFMADFEDSLAPTWRNVVEGQINLKDAVNYNLTFDVPGKHYELKDKIATLMVRPRGWHLNEDHVTVDGKPISAALFDFGLY